MWSRRAQEYEAKISSGKIYELAEVVRDLNKGDDLMVDQSYSERQLFEKAYDRILSEFQIVLGVSLEDTQKKLNKALDGITNCLIIPHKNPDADALGSSLALCSFLTKLGKKVTIVLPNSPPSYLNWMIRNNNVISYENRPKEAKKYLINSEIIFALDFNSLKRIGMLNKEIENDG